MRRQLGRRLAVAILSTIILTAGAVAAALVPASAPAAGQATRAANGTVNLRFNVRRFQFDRAHKRLVGHGNVVATYRSDGRIVGTTTRATTFTVQQATTCKVLHLELGELHLVLLGLYVNLTPVNAPSIVLDISANSNEALGHLFCQVLNAVSGASTGTTTTTAARTKVAKATSAARKLSSAFASKVGTGVFNTTVSLKAASTAATTTTTSTTPSVTTGKCPVLDLVLGPLNLDLLGLVVTLNQIDLNISADPTGTLGNLFCGLAGTTTTSTTTTPATTT
jgi:hypothetical protein